MRRQIATGRMKHGDMEIPAIAVERELMEVTFNTLEYATKADRQLLIVWPISIKAEKAACEGKCALYKLLATEYMIDECLRGYDTFVSYLMGPPPDTAPTVAYARGTFSPWVQFEDGFPHRDWGAVCATLSTAEIVPVSEDLQTRALMLVALLGGVVHRTNLAGFVYVWEKPSKPKDGDPMYVTDISLEDRPKWQNGESVAYG